MTKKAYNNIALLTYSVKTDARLINLDTIGRAQSAAGGARALASLPLAMPLSTGLRLLIDTGAEVSIVPPTSADLQRGTVGLTFEAVNSASIPTYDTRSLTLDLGLRRFLMALHHC